MKTFDMLQESADPVESVMRAVLELCEALDSPFQAELYAHHRNPHLVIIDPKTLTNHNTFRDEVESDDDGITIPKFKMVMEDGCFVIIDPNQINHEQPSTLVIDVADPKSIDVVMTYVKASCDE